jgi:predicted N-acyltransferase
MHGGNLGMTLDVQFLSSVDEVGQAAWDSLAGEQPFASYRWYRYGEAVLANDRPIYVILSSGERPIARATFWLTRHETLPIPSATLRLLVGTLLRRFPLLACRSPLSSAPGLILPEPPLRDIALETLVECGRDLLHRHRASFLLFDYLERNALDWPGWPARFVKVPDMSPGTELVIRWADFESYLGQMSKKHRYNIRRNFRLMQEEGIAIERYPKALDLDTAMALHHNVNARYKSATDHWMRSALQHADMVDSVWLAAEREGQILGCEQMLGDRGAWFVTGLGLDYGVKNVYFVLGYEDIRYAIEAGAKVLRWGTETYNVKRRLGFELEANGNLIFASRWAPLREAGRWVAEHSLY